MVSERGYDKTVADSFPASDPPANSGITGAEPAKRGTGEKAERKRSPEQDTAARPTGTPTSDRHATETRQTSEGEAKAR